MPIYEFYCNHCHMIFNFFTGSVNIETMPDCPKCKKTKLIRQMSTFAISKKRGDQEEMPMPDLDESKMAKAMNHLAREAEHLNEEDPRQAATLMRKLTDMTGLDLGPGMEEALTRMEAGEDPEKIEEEMGDLLEGEDPFNFQVKSAKSPKKHPPKVDEKLYYI